MKAWQSEFEFKSLSKGKNYYKINNKVSNKPWFKGFPINGNIVRMMTRLRTGHGLCGKKKYMFKLTNTEICLECNMVDDLEHVLLKCKKYENIREQYEIFYQVDNLIELLSKANLNIMVQIAHFYFSAGLDF